MVAAAIAGAGGASALSGLLGSNAASDAAKVQADAANRAADIQHSQFLTTQNNLAPFVQSGQNALSNYTYGLDHLSLPSAFQQPNISAPNPTTTAGTAPAAFNNQTWGLGANQQRALEATPGYQFTKEQGLRGVQNAAAAQGRGVSGNALTGAANYATGLANTTFNDQFKNALTGQGQNFNQTLQSQQQQFTQPLLSEGQQFNQLLGGQAQSYGQGYQNTMAPFNLNQYLASLGENAGAMTGNLGQQSAASQGNFLTSGAAAQAGGIIGANNALTGGLGSIGNLLMLNQLTGGFGSGGSNLFTGDNFLNPNYTGTGGGGANFGGG